MNTIGRTKRIEIMVAALVLCVSCGGDGPGDGAMEPSAQSTWYKDADGDGFSDGTTIIAADPPTGFYLAGELTATAGDCNDDDDSAHPGGIEINADGVDQDCNGFEVSGPEEVVFDWSTDRCEELDIPDLPARAFRELSTRPSVQGVLRNSASLPEPDQSVRRFLGPALNDVTHDCTVVMTPHFDADPSMFNDVEWIGATYTEDGSTIYAIVHNEFQGWSHPGYCSTPFGTADCWYNGLTLAVSTDAGLSYEHPLAPPLHLVAASSLQYENDMGRVASSDMTTATTTQCSTG